MATISSDYFRSGTVAVRGGVRGGVNDNPKVAEHRHSELDLLKSLAIVTVVLIHCINDRPFYAGTWIQQLLADWARFAVPGFLFAAGFLFPKDGASGGSVLRKLAARIVPPYVFCSLLWIAFSVFSGQESYAASRVFKELLLGQACGIYYFVFVISYLYLFGIALRRAPPYVAYAACGLAFFALMAAYAKWPAVIYPQNARDVMMRHPCLQAFPFLAGWVAAIHHDRWRGFLRRLRTRDVLVMTIVDLAAVGALQAWPLGDSRRGVLVQVHIYLFLILVLHFGVRINRPWKGIRFLSEASYGIYLVHMGFVLALHKAFHAVGAYDFDVRIFLSCGVALALTILVIAAIRRCIGSRSKILIGA